jgi:hypothetical protein
LFYGKSRVSILTKFGLGYILHKLIWSLWAHFQHPAVMQPVMPAVSPAPMHPFPAISPMAMMTGGPLMPAAPMLRPASAAPAHLLPSVSNPAFLQQQQMAMMAMRPPFGALPTATPGTTLPFRFRRLRTMKESQNNLEQHLKKHDNKTGGGFLFIGGSCPVPLEEDYPHT